MDSVQRRLRQLRSWFFVWFVAQAAIGTLTAAWVLEGMVRYEFLRHALGGTFGAAYTVAAGAIVSLLLLLLAGVVLAALLERERWARIVMLVIGWLTVVPGVVSLLALPVSSGLVESAAALSGVDGIVLTAVNVVTKGADLLFWSWAIYLLQFNTAVRDAFTAGVDASAPTPSCPAR